MRVGATSGAHFFKTIGGMPSSPEKLDATSYGFANLLNFKGYVRHTVQDSDYSGNGLVDCSIERDI